MLFGSILKSASFQSHIQGFFIEYKICSSYTFFYVLCFLMESAVRKKSILKLFLCILNSFSIIVFVINLIALNEILRAIIVLTMDSG